MKQSHFLLTLALLLINTAGFSQKKLTEKDVIGNWKMVIEIDKAMEEAKEELEEEEDNLLSQMILSATSGLVTGIMENIDISITFLKDGKAEVRVDAYDEKELEYTTWWIENGRLFIDDTESMNTDNDYWVMRDGILFSVDDEDGLSEYVYMKPLD